MMAVELKNAKKQAERKSEGREKERKECHSAGYQDPSPWHSASFLVPAG
jgi:hypothetical protein